jgi:hypothetical protein
VGVWLGNEDPEVAGVSRYLSQFWEGPSVAGGDVFEDLASTVDEATFYNVIPIVKLVGTKPLSPIRAVLISTTNDNLIIDQS